MIHVYFWEDVGNTGAGTIGYAETACMKGPIIQRYVQHLDLLKIPSPLAVLHDP